jgi:hypothetical protein
MKVCVTLVGVCRPSFIQVKSNIEANILYFNTSYPQHTFEYIVLTYKNSFEVELRDYAMSKGIKCVFLEAVADTDFIFPVKITYKNSYRLFYSMNQVMNYVSSVDCVIRVRLDSEILNLELIQPEEGVYYSLKESSTSVSDNIGYGSFSTMKKIWKHENCLIKGNGIEGILYSVLKKYSYKISNVKFHYKLYQTDVDFFDGVRQWSRRSREWIYDGTNYILRDL